MPLLPTSRNGLAIRIVLAASLTVPAAVTVSASASAAAGGPDQTAREAAPAGHRTVAATTAGTLLGWGEGNDGQLGNGHRTKVQSTPVRVRLPRGVTVTSVRAGCDHTLALTSTGRVLAWGFKWRWRTR